MTFPRELFFCLNTDSLSSGLFTSQCIQQCSSSLSWRQREYACFIITHLFKPSWMSEFRYQREDNYMYIYIPLHWNLLSDATAVPYIATHRGLQAGRRRRRNDLLLGQERWVMRLASHTLIISIKHVNGETIVTGSLPPTVIWLVKDIQGYGRPATGSTRYLTVAKR